MRAKEFIGESLDKPYGFDSSENEYGEPLMSTTLDDGSDLEMKFYKSKIQGVDGYGFEFSRNNKHNITGQGDEQRVFATALAMTQQFVNQHKPKALEFFASKSPGSQSREKLYDRLVQRYADKLGYVLDRADKTDEIAYQLFRKT